MSVQPADASDALVGHERPAKVTSFRERLLSTQAIFFVGIGLLATVAWVVFLGLLLFLAVSMIWLIFDHSSFHDANPTILPWSDGDLDALVLVTWTAKLPIA